MNPTARSHDRTHYLVQSPNAVNFVTGRTRNGEQGLMGVPGHYVAAAFFDDQGVLLRHEVRQLPGTNPSEVLRPGGVRGQERDRLWELLDAWKSEIGFSPQDVAITKFVVPQLGLGLSDLPQYLQEALDGSQPEPDEEYHQECLSDIEVWRRLGKFVVKWGSEYWMNSSGEVTDT